jgi:hypothetical protein
MARLLQRNPRRTEPARLPALATYNYNARECSMTPHRPGRTGRAITLHYTVARLALAFAAAAPLSAMAGAYQGTPAAIPGSFEAENFDTGGEGVGYHDLTASNTGGAYRTSEAVDIVSSGDPAGGGPIVVNFQTGEWLAYTVNVGASGPYTFALRASNNYSSPTAYHLEVDGVKVTGSVTVPNTGSWGNFQWVSAPTVTLSAGQHVVKVVADAQYFNVNTIRAVAASTSTSTSTPSYTGTPFTGTPVALPAMFEAENFDKGGEGVAYHDLTATNTGGAYRTSEAVDIVSSGDPAGGGPIVVNFQTGEWMAYTVNVAASGLYDLSVRASNNYGSPTAFHVEIDGVNVTGSVAVPNTGSWGTFQWVGKKGINVAAGKHVLKLVSDAQYFNVNEISVLASTTTSTTSGGTTSGGTTSGGTTSGGTTSGGTTSGGTTSSTMPAVGVYRWDAPSGPANVDAYSTWLGKPVTVAAAFEAMGSWSDIGGASWQLGPWSQWVKAQAGRNLALAVPMLPSSGGSLASCSTGQYDATWKTLANNLVAYGLTGAYLRLGWEMDGTWYPWKAAPGSGNEGNFAGCFRHIVQVMRAAQPSAQWKFVLNPTTGWHSTTYLDAVWPGDAYVDVVAIDLYDQSWAANTYPYPSTCDSTCRLTHQQNAWNDYSWQLNTIRNYAVAHNKTMALAEWGTANRSDGHGGGDNPYYIQQMHDFMANSANRVVFQAYFDVNASDGAHELSPADGQTAFPSSASLFRQIFKQ